MGVGAAVVGAVAEGGAGVGRSRLHGCAAFVWELRQACQRVGSHFLVCARSRIKVRTLHCLKDGRRIVRVPVRQKGQPRVILHWLELREIRVTLRRPGFRSTELRPVCSIPVRRPP